MSYILDALRKADAQRQRTRLPGLHAQPPAAVAPTTEAGWWRSPIAWAIAGALFVAGVVLAWPGAQSPVSVPVPLPTTAAVQEELPAMVPPASPRETHASVAATSIQPAPPQPRPEPQVPARVVATRSTPDRAAPAARAASAASSSAAGTALAAPSAAVRSSAPAAGESNSPPPGAPKLAISGGVYSTSAAQRLLIVGGQVFNEGSEVAPGVVLEQVRPNQALLSYQGQRYTVRY